MGGVASPLDGDNAVIHYYEKAPKHGEARREAPPHEDREAAGDDALAADYPADDDAAHDRTPGRAEAERESEELQRDLHRRPAERHMELPREVVSGHEAARGRHGPEKRVTPPPVARVKLICI